MRIPRIAVAALAALAVGGLLAVPALSGDGASEGTFHVGANYATAKQTRALEPAPGGSTAILRAREGSGITIRHLVTKQSFEVDTNFVLRIVCPPGLDPISGGALSGPELAISNSSRVDPESGRAEKRSWYIGVTNLEEPLRTQRFRGTIVCAKGI
jgi:hypothetical protein